MSDEGRLVTAPDTAGGRALRAFADEVEQLLPMLREEDPYSDWSHGVVWVLNRMRNAAATAPDTVQAPDVAALLEQLDGRHCCDARMGHDDERCMSCPDEAWPCPTSEIVRRLRALLGTDTAEAPHAIRPASKGHGGVTGAL